MTTQPPDDALKVLKIDYRWVIYIAVGGVWYFYFTSLTPPEPELQKKWRKVHEHNNLQIYLP